MSDGGEGAEEGDGDVGEAVRCGGWSGTGEGVGVLGGEGRLEGEGKEAPENGAAAAACVVRSVGWSRSAAAVMDRNTSWQRYKGWRKKGDGSAGVLDQVQASVAASAAILMTSSGYAAAA